MKYKLKQLVWLSVGILIMIGAGCATLETPTPAVMALPMPMRPVLPEINSDELQCLGNDVYKRLVLRQRYLRQYAEELETIVSSTRK